MKRRTFVERMTSAGAAAAMIGPRPFGARGSTTDAGPRRVTRLDDGWRFVRDDPSGAAAPGLDDGAWEAVTLPHTAHLEPLVTGPAGTPEAQWQGICWYRRRLQLAPDAPRDGRVLLRFDGAMNVAEVWLDGEKLGEHLGGYLPFVFDLTGKVRPGAGHVLAVRLDNTDNAVTGPKPLAQLDFNTYGGLYRSVWLIQTAPLHVTDALLADRPASGGVFVTFPQVSREAATVRVQTHVRSDHPDPRSFRVRVTLRGPDGAVVASDVSPLTVLPAGGEREDTRDLTVNAPRLWSPAAPDLHTVTCEVVTGDGTVDAETVRVGIRRFSAGTDGFQINGERMFLRGTNRHQEYPYIGYALSDAAQYRDARLIKEAGFDYIRLSHYAHAPAFMDACDELGIVVMDCIPGWQYFNRSDPAFTDLQYRNCRDLIRRDRNHPCVILWEVSLNETGMPPEFIARTHAIAHEEYPGDQCLTAGWVHGYDVFIDARQHGGCRHETSGACLVSEYGDWEYYAMNAGLDQGAWQNLTPAESNSRQLRWQGERALLQQATNFQEAHNDNRATIAFADGLWVMYDYNRGYAPDIESSGCADIFRIPKYSYQFFRSQRGADERLAGAPAGAMVFIASAWQPDSATRVRVFSNCDEVALSLNGRPIARQGPDRDRLSTRLAHPPFTFDTGSFRPGTLEAIGYVGGRRAAAHTVRTPGTAQRLRLSLDAAGRGIDRRSGDVLFCHASLEDAHGILVPDAWENVAFGVAGGGSAVGMNPLATDAGIASILLRVPPAPPDGRPQDMAPVVYALAIVPEGGASGTRQILSASLATEGRAPAHEVRYTTDGSEPGSRSAHYGGPVPASPELRASLLVDGRVVASLAADAAKFRIPASAPPEQRGPFRR